MAKWFAVRNDPSKWQEQTGQRRPMRERTDATWRAVQIKVATNITPMIERSMGVGMSKNGAAANVAAINVVTIRTWMIPN